MYLCNEIEIFVISGIVGWPLTGLLIIPIIYIATNNWKIATIKDISYCTDQPKYGFDRSKCYSYDAVTKIDFNTFIKKCTNAKYVSKNLYDA